MYVPAVQARHLLCIAMKLAIFTIVLDGRPFIEQHLPIFQQLNFDWKWVVIEGTAQNNVSTQWCQPQKPRLSKDGTTQYLRSITDKRVLYLHSTKWESKDAMVAAALTEIGEA